MQAPEHTFKRHIMEATAPLQQTFFLLLVAAQAQVLAGLAQMAVQAPDYGVGACGGGSGGDPNGSGAGAAPGGGGAAVSNSNPGGNGKVILTYSCNVGTTGQIGNGHTITYPPEMVA
jgi:hypothetical protein